MAMPPSRECPATAVAQAILLVWPALVAQTVASVVHTPVPCDVQALAREVRGAIDGDGLSKASRSARKGGRGHGGSRQ